MHTKSVTLTASLSSSEQQPGSCCGWPNEPNFDRIHLAGQYLERKRRGRFLEKSARPPSSESPLKYESASYFSPANYAINLDSCGEYSMRTWSTFGHWKRGKLRRFFNTIAQFTNACSIHSAFYQWRMIDDNQKRLISHLAIETELFHSTFVNPCMM